MLVRQTGAYSGQGLVTSRILIRFQTLYHRRKRNVNCVVGDQQKVTEKIVKNCQCSAIDFEW